MNPEAKKRILLIVTKSNFGGAQRYVFEIAKTLHTQGHEVAVASGGTEGLLIEKCQKEDIRHIPLNSLERDIGLAKEFKAVSSLFSTIREFKPDVVHLNSSKAGGLGAFIARILAVPNIVFTAHGWPFREDRSRIWKIIIWLLSFCTGLLVHKIIVVSKKDYADCPTALVRKKATVTYTGVSTFPLLERHVARKSLYPEGTISTHKEAIWLVTIAELTPNKNLAYAISAVAKYNRQHTDKYFYSIIGTGEEEEKLQKLIEEENAENEISLCGFVDEARKYLQAFDVFLLPSKKEGMPYVLFEAGIANLPLIASNTGGIPEFINHEENGLLIDPTDPETLTTALHYCNQKDNREYMGKEAYNRTRNFSLEKMLDQTFSLYGLRDISNL